MDFNARVSTLFRKNTQRDDMRIEKYQLQLTEQDLKTQIAYATSEAAPKEWAREEGRLVLPGDHPVIPMEEAGATPSPEVLPSPTAQAVDNWQVWQTLLFGE